MARGISDEDKKKLNRSVRSMDRRASHASPIGQDMTRGEKTEGTGRGCEGKARRDDTPEGDTGTQTGSREGFDMVKGGEPEGREW